MYARKYPNEVSGVVLLDLSSADAPGELKTRARLTPGSAADLEEKGVAESNQQVKEAGSISGYSPYRDCSDRSWSFFQGLGAHVNALAAATCYAVAPNNFCCRTG